MGVATARERSSRRRYSRYWTGAYHTFFNTISMAAHWARAACCQAGMDIVELGAADSDWMDFALDDRSQLPAHCARLCTELSALSEPAIRSILCASFIADRCFVLGLRARPSSAGWRTNRDRCSLQNLPGSVSRFLSATPSVALSGFRIGHGGGRLGCIYCDIRLECAP